MQKNITKNNKLVLAALWRIRSQLTNNLKFLYNMDSRSNYVIENENDDFSEGETIIT